MTMKSVLLNKNFLLSGDSLPARGSASTSFNPKGLSFFSMIRDVVQNKAGSWDTRRTKAVIASSSNIESKAGTEPAPSSSQSPIEGLRRAFLAKGIPLDQVVLDQKDYGSLRTILEKLDFPKTSVDGFFQQMVQNNPGRKTTLSNFFKDFSEFENDLKATSSPGSGYTQNLSVDKSLVPHIESALRDLGVSPETLDSLLPSVCDVDGNVNLKKLAHQLQEIQSSSGSQEAPELTEDYDAILTPELVEAMEKMELPTPRQSIGAPFSLGNFIGIMETKIDSVSAATQGGEIQDLTVLDEVSEISEKQTMDTEQVDAFFAFAEAMMVRRHFESRRDFQGYAVGAERDSVSQSSSLSEEINVTLVDPAIQDTSIVTDTVSSFSNLENVVFSDIPSSTEFGQHTNGENLEKNGIRVGVLDAPLSSGDVMPKADGVNVQHIGQSLQTDSGGMILANQADIKSGEPQFQFSDKMPQAGNASDIKLENEDSLSALSKGKPVVDRTTIQYSQLDSTRVNGGKEDVIILRSGPDSKVSDSSRVMDEVASASSNRQVQFSEKMVQAGNTSEIQQKSDNLQSDLNSEKNSRSLPPLHSEPEVVSNVSHSPSKGTVEIPRENLAKGTETRMMEMDLPDQILENQDLLRVVKRNKQTSENRFVSIWNKADGTGIGPQTIAALNGSERNEANGFSKEIDHLIDDIISGSVNSEEKVIKSSANKSMYSDNPGTSDRFSMLNQTNTSSANSVSQRENATATRFPPNVVETVGKEIAAFLQRGDRILKLQLKPAELGTVNIEMDTKENVVKLSIVAETSSARELFLSNHNELRRVLEGHGVRLENLDVQVNDGHGQSMADGNNGSDRQQNQRWGTRFARMDIVDDSGDTILPMRQNNDGLLDLLV